MLARRSSNLKVISFITRVTGRKKRPKIISIKHDIKYGLITYSEISADSEFWTRQQFSFFASVRSSKQ